MGWLVYLAQTDAEGEDEMNKGQDKGQMSDREVMKLALDYIKDIRDHCACEGIECDKEDDLVEALRQALEQEPWDTTDMAHRAGGLSIGQEGIVPSDYSSQAGDYSSQAGDCLEQEPVAWMQADQPELYVKECKDEMRGYTIPLYAAPPKREFIGLTDEEIQKVAYDMGTIGDLSHDEFDICRAIEAKLKEKNHGNAKG